MSEVEAPSASGYTVIQPSAGPYKANSIKEGFVCSGIYTLVTAALVVGLRIWDENSKRTTQVLDAEGWAHLIGVFFGQFLLIGLCLSSVIFYRRKNNVTKFILLEWRWWLVCLIFAALPSKAVLGWFWASGVYQIRLGIKRKRA